MPPKRSSPLLPSRRSLLWTCRVACALLLCSSAGTSACSGGAHARRDAGYTSQLRLIVSPAQAELYIDDAYQGVVANWRDGVVPMTAGDHRVELRAPGYYAERFDMRFEADRALTLTLDLEPELTLPADDETGDRPDAAPSALPPSPLVAPSPGVPPS